MGQRAFSSAYTRSIGGIVLPIPPNAFATGFLGTESPLSEGGRWIGGQTSGIFQGMQCTPGFCCGAGPSASPPYDDPTAVVAGLWGPVQTVEATLRIDAVEAGVNQEMELRLHTNIYPGRITGYEVLFSITSNNYIEIMRWEGLANNINQFTSINFRGSGTGLAQLVTGNRIKASIDAAGNINAYIDTGSGYGASVLSGTDTVWPCGNPGVGAFKHAGTAGPLTGFGISSFAAWAA